MFASIVVVWCLQSALHLSKGKSATRYRQFFALLPRAARTGLAKWMFCTEESDPFDTWRNSTVIGKSDKVTGEVFPEPDFLMFPHVAGGEIAGQRIKEYPQDCGCQCQLPPCP